MPKITELYCCAVYDADENDEGVPALNLMGHPMPLMGASLKVLDKLHSDIQEAADHFGKEIRVYKFTGKEQVGVFTPRPRTMN